MSLTYSTQASIAFKNISGKSITDTNKGVNNEEEGIFFNVDSNNVWVSQISITPSISVSNGVSVFVTADLTVDPTSNGKAYFATWPGSEPVGTDPTTLSSYLYGSGLLSNINSGDRVVNSIPPSYGVGYEAIPYSTGPVVIPPGDNRNWIYQYNSGIFFQQDVSVDLPVSIDLYVYTGNLLSDQQSSSDLNNIRVSLVGVDSYTGSATPSIFTYSINDIYLVDFDNSNTGSTAVTINIDSLEPHEVITFDEDGNPIGLTGGGEINTGQIYYLIWDGTNFQFYSSNPISSSPITYTNPSAVSNTYPLTHMRGLTFSNTTMEQMWDLLLYPYQQPNFTAFTFNYGSSPKEVGDDILAGTYAFTWNTTYPSNIVTNSIKIKDVTNNVNLVTATANDFLEVLTIGTVSKSTAASHVWRIDGTRTNGTGIYSTLTVSWQWRKFSGTQSLTSLTASQVQSLSTTALSTTRTGTYTFGGGGYKYFAWPTSFGSPLQFKDNSTNLAIAMAGVDEGYSTAAGSYYAQVISITNIHGETTNYYLFRTLNILLGTISIVVT